MLGNYDRVVFRNPSNMNINRSVKIVNSLRPLRFPRKGPSQMYEMVLLKQASEMLCKKICS